MPAARRSRPPALLRVTGTRSVAALSRRAPACDPPTQRATRTVPLVRTELTLPEAPQVCSLCPRALGSARARRPRPARIGQGIVQPQRPSGCEPAAPPDPVRPPTCTAPEQRCQRCQQPAREGPRCRAPRASPRAAKDKPGTQVGLLEQTSTADQVLRCAAPQPPVLHNGKREARAASRRAPARAGHGQGRGVRAAAAEFGGFWR